MSLSPNLFHHSHQSAQSPSIEREKSPPSKGNWLQPSSCTLCSQKSKQSFCVPIPTKKATNETKQVSPKKLQNEYNTPTTKKIVGAVVVTGAPPTALKEREILESSEPNTHPLRNMLSNISQGLNPQILVMLCLQENVLTPTQAILNNLPDPLVPNPFKVKQLRRITYISLVVNLRTSVCKSPLQTSSCSVIVALGNVNEITLLYTVIQPNSCPIENRACAKRQQAGSSFSNLLGVSSMNLSSTVGSTPISGSDSGGLDLFEHHSHQSAQTSSIKSPPSKGRWPQHGPPSSCTLHRQQLVCVRTLTKKATNATKPKVRKLMYNTPPTTERNVGTIVTGAFKEREPKLLHTQPQQDSIPLSRAQLAKCVDVEKAIDCDLHTGLSKDCLAFQLNLPSCF